MYAAASMSASSGDASETLILTSHPSPNGSELSSDGSATRAALTSTTTPGAAQYTSLVVLTDSTSPTESPASKVAPTSFISTNVTSVSWSTANWVNPSVSTSPLSMCHSWVSL